MLMIRDWRSLKRAALFTVALYGFTVWLALSALAFFVLNRSVAIAVSAFAIVVGIVAFQFERNRAEREISGLRTFGDRRES
jgi:hypothetical protein